MNSNRTKYASTPTYGMQKRNFAKKQAAAQPAPSPDFTQQPPLEENNPAAPFVPQGGFNIPQNAYSSTPSPQNVYTAAPSPQTPPVYYSNTIPVAASLGSVPSYAAAPAQGGYAGYPPQQTAPGMPSYGRPLGNATPAAGPNGYSPRVQGFVPPATGAPAGVPQSYGVPMGGNGSFNQPMSTVSPVGGAYPTAGYPTAGYPTAGNRNGGVPPYGEPAYPPVMMSASGGGNGTPTQPYPGHFGGAPAKPTPRQPFDMDKWLKILLYGVLPVLFIPCVFVTHTYDFLRYAFIVATVLTLSVLWYRQSFSSGLRTTLSIGYLALSIVVIALLVGGVKDVTRTNGVTANGAAQPSASPEVTVAAVVPETEVTPAPVEDVGESEAEQRLATFMDYWSVNNFEQMVNLVQPSWASTQDGAAQALFTVISNRTPLEYTIESISGTSGDSSRTVTMSANIDKNNGKDPVLYRFMILMVNEDGEWYVDPKSLATNETVTDAESTEEDASDTLAPRMTVTPVPAADTKLYYNANGGKYYHIDPNCSSVNKKYLPLSSSFLYSELDDSPYNDLEPCLVCGAPTESLGDLAAETTTTP